ncbi:MAG: Holliday junction resolvase RuvX [Anaerolineae bacterium]|nr:Holliday junction resolvase RuvX [Anaerolineae bacterium]
MRYLALDLGNTIGVAVSTSGMLARPVEVFPRTSRVADFQYIGALVIKYDAEALIIGLPLNMDGSEGQQAAWVRDYSAELAQTLSIPIHLWDERLSTEDAAGIMRTQGKLPDKNWIDAVAAAVILQGYLDAQQKL